MNCYPIHFSHTYVLMAKLPVLDYVGGKVDLHIQNWLIFFSSAEQAFPKGINWQVIMRKWRALKKVAPNFSMFSKNPLFNQFIVFCEILCGNRKGSFLLDLDVFHHNIM